MRTHARSRWLTNPPGLLLCAVGLALACGSPPPEPEPTTSSPSSLALVDGTLIDGTGAPPVADAAAHMPYDPVPDELIRRMAEGGFVIVPTLTALEAYGALPGTSANLRRFVAAGGQVALGNDYSSVPAKGFDHFELGMPMHDITRMRDAGMTPMQIVVAATRTAARACGRGSDLGVVAEGKIADVLVVDGDPLVDLTALSRPRVVVHDGVVIRGGS
jgi:cytosine/adenosine deaminase-related metal-dependent hydrolase